MTPEEQQEHAEEQQQLLNDTVASQIQQFLDDWHYHMIVTLGTTKGWNRSRATLAALTLFELQGVPFEAGEKESLVNGDESILIHNVVGKMPEEFKKTFEQFALKLQLIVTTATRVRKVVDQGDPDAVQESMDQTDDTGIVAQILKHSIAKAGEEVARIRNRHTSWTRSTDTRVARLIRSAEDAEAAQRELDRIMLEVNGFGGAQNEKSKKMMAGVAGKNDKVLCSMIFGGWMGYCAKVKSEKGIRDMFEEEIANLDFKLMEFRQAALVNVRNVLMRKAGEGDRALIQQVWKAWADEVQETKREAGSQDAAKAMEAKMAAQSTAQMENTKKVMSKMAAGSDGALLTIVVTSWVQWLEEYKKNKDIEDAVKAQEAAMKAYMEKKKNEATGVLDRMNAATDSGLLEHIVSTWIQFRKDDLEAKKMEEMMAANEAKFAGLNGRQKDNAKGVMGRVNEQMQLNVMLRHFSAWARDAKMERIMRHYNSKMENKKEQLQSVQHLFKNFANQLDQGLKGEDSARNSGNRGFLPDIQGKK